MCILSVVVCTLIQRAYAEMTHQFAKEKNWQEALAMIAEGHDPNEICEDGSTLISIACDQKNWTALKTLITNPDTRLPKGMETVDAVRMNDSNLKSICDGIGPVDKICF
ncbi:MAG: hypothetical protein AB8G05_03535 [Oligoflexales bacterium]